MGNRDSWCFIRLVGYSDSLLHEALSKRFAGGAEVKTKTMSLPLHISVTPQPPSGTSKIQVRATSKGFNDGNSAEIRINSKYVFGTIGGAPTRAKRGMNVVVIDDRTGILLSLKTFDTHLSRIENSDFKEVLKRIPKGRILAITVKDEASKALTRNSRILLAQLGSKRIIELDNRKSLCLIVRTGNGNKQLREAFEKRGSGLVEVKLEL